MKILKIYRRGEEIRCRRCRRLLIMKGEIKQVEIKCPKCGCVQTEAARSDPPQT